MNNRKKILITGASGMLGSILADILKDYYNVFLTGRNEPQGKSQDNFLSFDLNQNSYNKLLLWSNPDIVIHCAAITNVDYCELNPEEANIINYESIKKICDFQSIKQIIFISSDAVFDGSISNPSEQTVPSPLNIYGLTKYKSEQYLLEKKEDSTIIRTTIIGRNNNPKAKKSLLDWIISSLRKKNEIELFNDVLFNPISTFELAHEIHYLIENTIKGIIHISGVESITKYDFGFRICEHLDLDTSLIKKVSIQKSKFVAKRSNNQSLDSSYYINLTGRTLPTVDTTLHRCFN